MSRGPAGLVLLRLGRVGRARPKDIDGPVSLHYSVSLYIEPSKVSEAPAFYNLLLTRIMK